TLGRRGDSVGSAVFVCDDGELLFGDAAERRGITQPERLIREFKRGVGDEVPHSVGGRRLTSAELYAQTVASVVDAATEREGRTPDILAVTHPTAWGPHRIGMVEAALARLGMTEVMMITEPEAAARHYAAGHPLAAGQALAVYDLGGGTFDTIILRAEEDGDFAPAAAPSGIDDLGGADFDDAVLRHVLAVAGVDTTALALDDPDISLGLAQLRRECVDAKEALSFDSDVTIPVLIGADRATVRLTRAEFEDMIAPALDRTVDALDAACEEATLEPRELEAILLIGGSSRIPLVAQRLSERFDRPIAVDTDPKASVALGAARTALIRVNDQLLAAPVAADEPGTALAL